jgi:hypothetical protein
MNAGLPDAMLYVARMIRETVFKPGCQKWVFGMLTLQSAQVLKCADDLSEERHENKYRLCCIYWEIVCLSKTSFCWSPQGQCWL